jgi:uncharacterized protein YndB with AHSA1/START domain
MSVKKEPSGRRSVSVEVEVPGTPEEVWQAIATGPGVSSWFVPTEFRDDGTVVSDFGPGMQSVATPVAWDPPWRYAKESPGWAPGSPPMATEWIVEARAGGTCVVRVVHSLFASTDDWDAQLEGTEHGWPWFFEILKLYLAHFRGERGSTIRVMGAAPTPAPEAWDAVTTALGLAGAAPGLRVSAPADLPPLAGTVEKVGETQDHHGVILRVDEPCPGLVSLVAPEMGGQVLVSLDFHLYGEQATAVCARDEPAWQRWMGERFPFGGFGGGAG